MWLLGQQEVSKGLAMMDISSSEMFMWSKLVKHLKYSSKFNIPLSPTKNVVARGNQR